MTAGRMALLTMQFIFSLWTYYTGYLSKTLIALFLMLSVAAIRFLRETNDADMVESARPFKVVKIKSNITLDKVEVKSSQSKRDLQKPLVNEEEQY